MSADAAGLWALIAAICAGVYFSSWLVGVGTFGALVCLAPWEPRR